MNWYKKAILWYKTAQLWNVNTQGGIEELMGAFYELEYKYNTMLSNSFVGIPQRKENILQNLKENLSDTIEQIKNVLIKTYEKWLTHHALLSPHTWARQRVTDSWDSMGTLDSYVVMLGEYERYAIAQQNHLFDSQKQQAAYNKYFRDMLSMAFQNRANFPSLETLARDAVSDYRFLLLDELESSEGLKEFNSSHNKEFKSVEEAKDWVNSLEYNDVDCENLFYFDDVESFINMAEQVGIEEEFLISLYQFFVFPHWLRYWTDMGIEDTRETIEGIYKRLQSINANDIGSAQATISIALNAAHQNGDMLEYIAEESGGDIYSSDKMSSYLTELSGGDNVAEWNKQLQSAGVQI